MVKTTEVKSKKFLAEKWNKRKEKLAHTQSLDEKISILDDYEFTFDIVLSYAESIDSPEEDIALIKRIIKSNGEEIKRVLAEKAAQEESEKLELDLLS